MHPVAEGGSRNVQSMPHQDILAAIRGQMIAALADNQRCQQTGTGDAPVDRLVGNRRRGNSALPACARIFLQMMIVNFQLPGNELQHPADLRADARLLFLAGTADFFFRLEIVLMINLRQSIQTQLPVRSLPAPAGSPGFSRRSLGGSIALLGVLRIGFRQQAAHVKQMLLSGIRNMPFTT